MRANPAAVRAAHSERIMPVERRGVKNISKKALALVVDITATSPHYDAALSKAFADHSEVVFRTSPYFRDRTAFPDSLLRRDFLGTATWIADRWPAIVRWPSVWKIVQLHGYFSAWRCILSEIVRTQTPVLHIQWCKLPLLDLWLMRRAQKHGVRIAYTVHNALPHLERRALVRRMYRQLYRQADALIVLSRSVGQQIIDWVDDSVAHKIHVIEHGILELPCPIPNRNDARVELNLDQDADFVLFMVYISQYKCITDLLDAINIARRHRPKLKLIIAGKPDEDFEPYRTQIRNLELTDIVRTYTEYVPEKFKAKLYAAADVAVLPHREASQSAMGLEALAAGQPIIATRTGGLVDLVQEGVNGYSVPVKDSTALAESLNNFFSLSRPAQQAMGVASRTIGRERFGWPMIARKHIDLYLRLINRDRSVSDQK